MNLKTFVILPVLALSGCATTAAGLLDSPIEQTVQSDKSPQQFAECSVDNMSGQTDIRGSGDHYYVLRFSGYQMPYARWDFRSRPGGGSVAELRRANISVGSGAGDVRDCA
ncbi:MAG TPA: hypothetical protein VIN76_01470 [Parasphingorhabdus sp.]